MGSSRTREETLEEEKRVLQSVYHDVEIEHIAHELVLYPGLFLHLGYPFPDVDSVWGMTEHMLGHI